VNFLKKGDGITNVELIGSASVVFQGSFDTDLFRTLPEGDRPSRRSFLTQALTAWVGLTLLPALYAMVEYIIPPAMA